PGERGGMDGEGERGGDQERLVAGGRGERRRRPESQRGTDLEGRFRAADDEAERRGSGHRHAVGGGRPTKEVGSICGDHSCQYWQFHVLRHAATRGITKSASLAK